MWDSVKITPLNSTIGYSHSGRLWQRKLGGFLFKILKNTHSNIVVNARYYENAFSLNFCNKYLDKQSNIVDIGSAESDFPLLLHASGFDVTAFDQREYPFIKSKQGDALKLSSYFDNQAFNAISAISTIEHIGLGVYGDNKVDTNYFNLISEWKKLLQKDGYLILTLPVTSMEKRREKGQWVENILNLKKTIDKTSGHIIEEQLVVKNDSLSNKWELQILEATKDYDLGVYMAGIKF